MSPRFLHIAPIFIGNEDIHHRTMNVILVCLIAAVIRHHGIHATMSLPRSSIAQQRVLDLHRRVPHDLASRVSPAILRASADREEATPSSPRVSPVAYGADPYGKRDSWKALQQAIHECVNRSVVSPVGYFPGFDTEGMPPVGDAGGCFVDLEGGEYLVSKTLSRSAF